MKKILRLLFLINMICFVVNFGFYSSNNRERRQIEDKILSMEEKSKQLDEEREKVKEIEMKQIEEVSSDSLDATQPWGRHINEERREFYGDWKITEVLRKDSIYAQKNIGTIISLGRRYVKKNDIIVAEYLYYEIEIFPRSEERRVGKECLRPWSSRTSPFH